MRHSEPRRRGSDSAGFWQGLWQGFIAPIAFLVSLFNHDVGIYEVHNNGAWYDFGYIVGLTVFFSGGSAGARTRPRTKKEARRCPFVRTAPLAGARPAQPLSTLPTR